MGFGREGHDTGRTNHRALGPATGLLLVFLAGCTAAPPGNTAGFDGLVAPAGEHDETTCGLEGIVYDDEARPVEGANVKIMGADDATRTDVAGRFAFSHLPPAVYGVRAGGSGFLDAMVDVDCVRGETRADVGLQLLPRPDATQAYKVIHQPVSGKIACALGHLTSTSDLCQGTPLGEGDSYRTEFIFAADAVPITGAVFELAWNPSTGSGGKFLSLDYPQAQSSDATAVASAHRRHDAAAGIVYGESPLAARLESGPSGEPVYLLQPGDGIRLTVRPSSMDPQSALADPAAEETSKVVFQQDFAVYAAVFYNGESVPDDFTSRPS